MDVKSNHTLSPVHVLKCRRTRRHETYKMLVRYTRSSVFLRLIFYANMNIWQYNLCSPISFVKIVSICVLDVVIIFKSKVWTFLHDRTGISPWIKLISNELDSRNRITIVSLLWRHQKSIVTSWAEQRPSEWQRGRCVKIVVFIVIVDFFSLCR